MSRFLFIVACIFFLNSCCNKKACPGDELPSIAVRIVNVPANNTVTLYKVDEGKRDSTFFQVSEPNSVFFFFPVNDFDDTGVGSRQFIIRHGSRLDTIKGMTGHFADEAIVCDGRWGCGRGFGNGKTTVKRLVDFNFLCRGQNFGLRDTLVLD